jgi:NADPH:quinone reductase-like Zn-dependent oxidoreductase
MGRECGKRVTSLPGGDFEAAPAAYGTNARNRYAANITTWTAPCITCVRPAARVTALTTNVSASWVSYGQATGALDPVNLSAKSDTFSQPVLFHYTADYLPMAGRVFAALHDGILKPDVRRRYPLAGAADAHRDLEARRTTGQIVLLA